MISAEELEKEIEALVAEHCKDLRRYLQCQTIRLPEYLMGDVINDALLVIADKLRRGHTIDNVRSYFFTVAKNAAIDRLKARYAEIPDPVAIAEHQDGHDMLANAEIRHDLRHAIKQLPPVRGRLSNCATYASPLERQLRFSIWPKEPSAPLPRLRCAN